MFYFLFAENALPPPLPFLLLLLLPPRLWFGFLKSCPQDIRHHFTVYNFRGRAALQPSPRTLLIIHINSVETKKERVEWDGAVMKEDEMVRLEAGNIGRERKIKVQRKEKGEIRRGMRGALEKGDWIEVGGKKKERKWIKKAREECTCQPCATHPQAICSATSRALHWLACHYIPHMAPACVFIHTGWSHCECVFTCSSECDVLARVRPRACFHSQIFSSSGVRSLVSGARHRFLCAHMGLVWSVITPVHWGFQSNACGRVGDSLEWNNQGYRSAGFLPPGPHPDYG